jgi:chitinase
MVSTPETRKTFIDSVLRFMDKYGFQGADLDWEYPVSEDRGGRKNDTMNFVSLLAEMRATFGKKYGISLALAPDIWYLRRTFLPKGSTLRLSPIHRSDRNEVANWREIDFDAAAMQEYVDWFGFMAYDLHGVCKYLLIYLRASNTNPYYRY